MIENGPDDIRIGDIRDDPECPPAARAHGNIDLEDSFEALGPGQGSRRLRWLDRGFGRSA